MSGPAAAPELRPLFSDAADHLLTCPGLRVTGALAISMPFGVSGDALYGRAMDALRERIGGGTVRYWEGRASRARVIRTLRELAGEGGP